MRQTPILPKILTRLSVVAGPDRRGEYTAWCPFHADGRGKPPHEPNLHISERGWFCHVCNRGGPLKELVKELKTPMPTLHKARVVTTYDYHDEKSNLLFQVVRFRPKAFRQRRPDGNGGWDYSVNGTRRVLYRLPDLLACPDEQVFVVEGEKDADRLAEEGLVATTCAMGAGKWRPEYSESLRGRDVVILPDNDTPGRRHGRQVARSLQAVGCAVRLIELPGLAVKGDISDWFDAGHTVEELTRLVEQHPLYDPARDSENGDDVNPLPWPRGRRRQADKLVDLAKVAQVQLLHDAMGKAYVRFPTDGHWEIRPCGDEQFRAWLTARYVTQEGSAPNLTALRTAVNVLQSQAVIAGERVVLHNRVAWHEGAIWYDLGDERRRAVRIAAGGWRVEDDPPVLFRRWRHQAPQVEPGRGGDLDEVWKFVNIRDPRIAQLYAVYLIACLVPVIPHPVAIVYGPQGSAKTTLARVTRSLIDPSSLESTPLPKDEDRLAQLLSHNWFVPFDNISSLPRWVSDALCRAATGDTYVKRALYTDEDDVIFQYRRCCLVNGINVAGCQPDLLDRALLLELPPIDGRRRRDERRLQEEFEAARPAILGAMFTALAGGMAALRDVQAVALPRMADFARWGCAIARAMGYETDFLEIYHGNVKRQNAEALAGHVIAGVLLELMARREQWEGSASELLRELCEVAKGLGYDVKNRCWPRQPNRLIRMLNEVQANLEAVGITMTRWRSRRGSRIRIQRCSRAGDSEERGPGIETCDDGDDEKRASSRSSSRVTDW